MTDPVIVMVAPNGARKVKADHPAIPLTPDEIGRDAARCREAGAAAIHLHVRDRDGAHVLDADLYRAAVAAVRREAGRDFFIQVTTEAVGRYRPQEQIALVRALMPEAFSIAIRELVPDGEREGEAASFLAEQARAGVLVQYILYDAGDVLRFQDLVEREVVPLKAASALFVLGRYAADQQSSPRDLLPFLEAWRLDIPWSLCAFGRREAECLTSAAALGGHVRVGFENNTLMPDGTVAPDNAALVARIAEVANALGRRLAAPDEARAAFGAG